MDVRVVAYESRLQDASNGINTHGETFGIGTILALNFFVKSGAITGTDFPWPPLGT